ncbi:MAG: hypothetical protein SF187_25620 [Deltaproteobacteria bacterium]|nr:hypothetical protein [Deltaproteobacteria bacterium]
MLPPALFYGLAGALIFFGLLRLVYLGVFADKRSPAKPKEPAGGVGTDERGDADDDGETIDDETRSERYRQPPRMGFGLISLMGLGRMAPAKRHTVMGALWIVLGLYMAWTAFNLSRQQQAAAESVEDPAPMRVIRARVGEPGPAAAPPAEAKPAPSQLNAAPAEIKPAPSETPPTAK